MSFGRTREGYRYSVKDGFSTGYVTEAAVSPLTYTAPKSSSKYDTIVIGAGYAGLIAARDLAISGQSVLLIEARDRIGGRTWTSQENGTTFEMGGTWVHWVQGFTWKELVRYGLDQDLFITPNKDFPEEYKAVVGYNDEKWTMDPEQLDAVLESALNKFCNIDLNASNTLLAIPSHFPTGPFVDQDLVKKYDAMSVADRFAECKQLNLLSDLEVKCLAPWASRKFGARLDKCGLIDLIKWYRFGNGSCAFLGTTTSKFKLRSGQSHFARCIFEEALETKNLSYAFDAPVSEIIDKQGSVEVVTSKGTFTAPKVVVTTPMNVTNKIKFSPPLSPLRKEAFSVGQVNFGHKIHSVIANPALRSKGWSAFDTRNPIPLASAFGDQVINNGKSAVVPAFGMDNADPSKVPSKDPKQIREWLGRIDPELKEKYEGSHWSEWVVDPYSKGTWSMFGPGFYTKYWAELQKPHGNINFASADYSVSGWKGFIDGAIADGARVAMKLTKEWQQKARL
ncbi:hypothetical protein MNV49_004638 [Pseudohyphozyma bogoriensis]|nr:hypothetical protein MNV49_004638 [Pseudohyphozyma bogoriensis]